MAAQIELFFKSKGYRTVNIHEFGKENEKTILLIHPSVVKWDYFEYVIPAIIMKSLNRSRK